MTKDTLDEVKTKLAALRLPEVTEQEILTLVTEPLAHIEVKHVDGTRLQVWTHAAVFTVDLTTCRIGVVAELTAGLHQARTIVQAATNKTKRGRKRQPREQVETLREESLDAPEIDDSLAQDNQAGTDNDDDTDTVEEVVNA